MKTLNFKKAAIATLLVLAIPVAQAGDWTGNVGGSVGSKQMDDQDWGALDSHGSIGFMLDVKKKPWPVSLTYDLILSGQVEESGSVKDEAYSLEHHFGVRKTFEFESSSVRPYIGGGLALVSAGIKNTTATSSVDDDDSAVGAWVGTGMLVGITDGFDIGFDVRYSEADVTIFNRDIKAGGLRYALTASHRW